VAEHLRVNAPGGAYEIVIERGLTLPPLPQGEGESSISVNASDLVENTEFSHLPEFAAGLRPHQLFTVQRR
jgi:hypothetical protein